MRLVERAVERQPLIGFGVIVILLLCLSPVIFFLIFIGEIKMVEEEERETGRWAEGWRD